MAFVYLIIEEPVEGEVVKDWVKIGYTQNPPEWRMGANLNPGNPRTIRVVAAFEYETNDAAWDAEKSAHEEFRKYLHQKEWFKIHWKTVNDWFLSQGAKHRQEVSVKP
ncbi:MAG: GIY-YIG nuclease family protein [Smithella sp.]